MTKKYDDFISFLEKYRDELAFALSNEREKRQALLSSDIERLEAILQVQQAETMKLKGFESKRATMQAELGFDDYTAKEIVAAVSDAEAGERLGLLFSEIVDLVNDIKQQNKLAIELANTDLKLLDRVFNNIDSNAQNGLYTPDSNMKNPFSKGSSIKEII